MAKLTHVNPDNVPDYLTYGLSHAVVAEGGKTIYLSGQVGWNEKSESVGPDLAAQLAQAHENIRPRPRRSRRDGGRHRPPQHTNVANYRFEEGEVVNAANKKLFEGHTPPSMTLMGVQALYSPDVRCEVEVTAVIGCTSQKKRGAPPSDGRRPLRRVGGTGPLCLVDAEGLEGSRGLDDGRVVVALADQHHPDGGVGPPCRTAPSWPGGPWRRTGRCWPSMLSATST